MAASCASARLDDDELVDHLVSELLEDAADDGCPESARASSCWSARRRRRRAPCAAAAAHVRSGAPIFCVLAPEANGGRGRGGRRAPSPRERGRRRRRVPRAALARRSRLAARAAAPRRHTVLWRRRHALRVAGATAATDKWAEPPTDGQLARGVAALVMEGGASSSSSPPASSPALQLQANGGGGLGHHLARVVFAAAARARARRRGGGEAHLHQRAEAPRVVAARRGGPARVDALDVRRVQAHLRGGAPIRRRRSTPTSTTTRSSTAGTAAWTASAPTGARVPPGFCA